MRYIRKSNDRLATLDQKFIAAETVGSRLVSRNLAGKQLFTIDQAALLLNVPVARVEADVPVMDLVVIDNELFVSRKFLVSWIMDNEMPS